MYQYSANTNFHKDYNSFTITSNIIRDNSKLVAKFCLPSSRRGNNSICIRGTVSRNYYRVQSGGSRAAITNSKAIGRPGCKYLDAKF